MFVIILPKEDIGMLCYEFLVAQNWIFTNLPWISRTRNFHLYIISLSLFLHLSNAVFLINSTGMTKGPRRQLTGTKIFWPMALEVLISFPDTIASGISGRHKTVCCWRGAQLMVNRSQRWGETKIPYTFNSIPPEAYPSLSKASTPSLSTANSWGQVGAFHIQTVRATLIFTFWKARDKGSCLVYKALN